MWWAAGWRRALQEVALPPVSGWWRAMSWRQRRAKTALIIAAEGIDRQHDSSMIATVIALGADKNAVDDSGCSALGYYLRALGQRNDLHAKCFNFVAEGGACS